MECSVSVKDRITAHLGRYRTVDLRDKYNLPWDITQDGIASSLGITRAHASLELKKLRETGIVDEMQVHVKGGKVKRKCYSLTPIGMETADRIVSDAQQKGIDVFSFIDVKKQDPSIILDSLKENERFCMGCACTLRIPVHRDLLPNRGFDSLPVDFTGKTALSDTLKKNILSLAAPEELRAWNSYAADCWLDHLKELGGDEINMIHERLYHLVNAGRMTDACRLVSNNIHELISTATDDLCETLQKISPFPEKYAADVLSARIETDMDTNDVDDMKESIALLEPYEHDLSVMYSSDLAYATGDRKEAMTILRNMDLSDPLVNIRIAKLMYEDGEYEGAKMILNSLGGINTIGRVDVAVERFILLAYVDRAEGRDADAYAHLMKARASLPDRGKRRVDIILESMGLQNV